MHAPLCPLGHAVQLERFAPYIQVRHSSLIDWNEHEDDDNFTYFSNEDGDHDFEGVEDELLPAMLNPPL